MEHLNISGKASVGSGSGFWANTEPNEPIQLPNLDYIIIPYDNIFEQREKYFLRIKYIIDKLKSNNYSYEKLDTIIKYSKIYANTIIYGCAYSQEIMNKINANII